MSKLTLGCDPELFLVDAANNLTSCIGLIGGTKEVPLGLPLGDGYAVQEDNVAVEFNIPPASSAAEFSKYIRDTVAFLEGHTKEKYGLAFSRLSAACFPPDQLTHPAALEFGCDPDFNAWTGRANPRPKATDATLRSCGGHVHIGYKFAEPEDKIEVVKLCDLFLGVPSILVDHEGGLRRQLYGKAGAYRTKAYGVEYRTLSNFWVINNLHEWVWANTQRAVESLGTIDANDVRDDVLLAINSSNIDAAQRLVSRFNIQMP